MILMLYMFHLDCFFDPSCLLSLLYGRLTIGESVGLTNGTRAADVMIQVTSLIQADVAHERNES